MTSQCYTDNDVISFFCGEESALDEIIMDGSDDLGFDDEIEIEDDDGKVAKWKIVCMIYIYKYCLHPYSYSCRWPALHQPWPCRRGTTRATM